jgi:hypothetical protein
MKNECIIRWVTSKSAGMDGGFSVRFLGSGFGYGILVAVKCTQDEDS